MNNKATKEQLYRIHQNLPFVRDLLHGEECGYKYISVSVFDHWLTRDEFDQIFYSEGNELESRRLKFENFVKSLYEVTNPLIWKHKRHDRVYIYQPNSLEHLLLKCDIKNQTDMTGRRYDILLPEFSAVYSEEWDWTNLIWYRDKQKIEPLLELVKKAGLHIINE